MNENVEITRKDLAAKIAAGENFSIEEVLKLNEIASEEKAKAREAANAEKVADFAKDCSKKIAGFEGTAKELKIALRDMATHVPTVSGNGSNGTENTKPLDPERMREGSYGEFVLNQLKDGAKSRKELVAAAMEEYPDREFRNIDWHVMNKAKRLTNVTCEDGKFALTA